MLKNIYKIAITLVILLIFLFIVNYNAQAEYNLEFGNRILRFKDRGADVAILQQKLRDLSLYSGVIDGIFGQQTRDAVKKFQRKHNLKVDGIVGPATYDKLPPKKLLSRMKISREEITQLARIIHGEARGESFEGKVAVGAVVLNRVKSDEFPDSIRQVILQKNQFSCLLDGQANLYPTDSSIEAAKAALLGYDPTYSSLYFYNPSVATNVNWIQKRPVVKRIGNHIFAK